MLSARCLAHPPANVTERLERHAWEFVQGDWPSTQVATDCPFSFAQLRKAGSQETLLAKGHVWMVLEGVSMFHP